MTNLTTLCLSFPYRGSAIKSLASALVLSLLAVSGGMTSAAGKQVDWHPEPVKYGYGELENVPVRMDDGITLRVNEYFPTDVATKRRAAGRFPVLLAQTPYGKDLGADGYAKDAEYFVRRGYVLILADLRGFGQSQGQGAWFGTRMARDGAELVQWAAHLDNSNGKVGLMGCSYLGVIQFFTANSVSAGSPLKAMTPFCVDSNFYRDLTAFGGIPTQFVLVDRAV